MPAITTSSSITWTKTHGFSWRTRRELDPAFSVATTRPLKNSLLSYTTHMKLRELYRDLWLSACYHAECLIHFDSRRCSACFTRGRRTRQSHWSQAGNDTFVLVSQTCNIAIMKWGVICRIEPLLNTRLLILLSIENILKDPYHFMWNFQSQFVKASFSLGNTLLRHCFLLSG